MPLTVLIAGAGIAGLSCAIALGREGHTVHLFEKSRFSNEVGAAFHFGPHAHRILRRWNFDIESLDPCACLKWQLVTPEGDVIRNKFDLREKQNHLGVTEDEIMIHRADTHAALREYALKMPNVTLNLSSGLQSVDTSAASITLEDGSTHQGDIVVGADGVHSKSVRFLTESECQPFKTGVNMYRFMVSYERASKIKSVERFLTKIGYMKNHTTIVSQEASWKINILVLYPCRGGSLLNMATFQPASVETVALGSTYTNPGTVEEVLDLFEPWPEPVQELGRLAEDVKHWACVSANPRETFVNKRLVCVGDAAHPTLPTHGAGAGMAIEDAAVLGAVLDGSVTRENALERLELYNDLRYERATTIKCASEMLGDNSDEQLQLQESLLRDYVPSGSIPLDVEAYLWPVDVVQQAKDALARLAHTSNVS